MGEETEIGGPNVHFQPTLWTTVLRAKEADSPGRREALDGLIRAYWKPVYFFIRRRGHDVESAKDLSQAFFAAFLEKDFLRNVSPGKGRFRSFVMASLCHFLSDEYDRSKAVKRGGDFNFVRAEAELEAAAPTPEQAFFRQWALEVMVKAMGRLRAESSPEDFDLLTDQPAPGLGATDRKNRLHRMRLRLRELLREEVAPSVEREEDIDAEIREIFSAVP